MSLEISTRRQVNMKSTEKIPCEFLSILFPCFNFCNNYGQFLFSNRYPPCTCKPCVNTPFKLIHLKFNIRFFKFQKGTFYNL